MQYSAFSAFLNILFAEFSLFMAVFHFYYAVSLFYFFETSFGKTDPLALMEAEILFEAGFAAKRLPRQFAIARVKRIAGNSSLNKNTISNPLNPKFQNLTVLQHDKTFSYYIV
ncbi:hypothetical protein [Flavobacterium chungbukense]|uniref:hypothetical protein n=1 Tax=Flavobacterium chungbukense TaxID=877464 RepID=UPI001E5F63B8|nr:hypothetical protein [Flavobacterium chungbukense]MCC4924006.1 hypothetical protein [Flavobacterium chungbukense]